PLDIQDLPSLKYFIQLMFPLSFEEVMSFIKNPNKNEVSKCVNDFKVRLNDYLKVINKGNNGSLPPIVCRNINYNLDIIDQGINSLKGIEYVKLAHDINKTAKELLQAYNTGCKREYYKITGNNIHYRKVMDVLCLDISYINENMEEIKQNNRKSFLHIYQNMLKNEFFPFNKYCTLDKINEALQTIDCKELIEPSNPSLQIASKDVPVEGDSNMIMETTLKDSQSTQKLENLLQNSSQEETPNLNTTYAAVSLTAVSLLGVLLYKVMYNYKNEYYFHT
ncbi:Pv-fam-c protein, partial [Plasmodium cynomolgi strain B]